MSNRHIIVSGDEQAAEQHEAEKNAAEDACYVIQNSRTIANLVAVDIIARQLFLLVRQGLEVDIKEGWEIENPDLVIKMLTQSSEYKSVSEAVRPTDLRQQLLETVLPVVDIFCEMEKERDERSNDGDTVPRDNDKESGEVAGIPGTTESDALDETGQQAEGDRKEGG